MRLKEYITKRRCRVCGKETHDMKKSVCSCGYFMYPIGYIYTPIGYIYTKKQLLK